MAEGEGTIEFVDATVIRIRYDRTEEFVAFESRQGVPYTEVPQDQPEYYHRPSSDLREGSACEAILTEGYSTENGELALGRNLKVAFMPWKGYNYEDAIVLNELLTSVHVDEYPRSARD